MYCCRHANDDAVALYHTTERFGAGKVEEITFGQLRERVREVAAALKRLMVMMMMMMMMMTMMVMMMMSAGRMRPATASLLSFLCSFLGRPLICKHWICTHTLELSQFLNIFSQF